MKITFRIWILIIALILAVFAISPWMALKDGAVIKSVERNTTEFEQGLRQGMIISSVNGIPVTSSQDYSDALNSITFANETRWDIVTDQGQFIFLTSSPSLNITVGDIPSSNIKTGLDLSGGARALVKPEKALSSTEMQDLIAVTSNRLNVFGISDVSVRSVSDLSGNSFMLVEVAGATPSDLRELVAQQGKFEAKIGNETVFIGGERDINYVAKSGQEAGIEACYPIEGGYSCRFRFAVHLSPDAAKRHADITSKLGVNISSGGRYLDKPLDLYVDETLVDTLLISEDLKGRETTEIAVSGSGIGKNKQEAFASARDNMKKLQTILITGSLPYKLEIVKLDSISPVLGKEFARNLVILAFVVFGVISLMLFLKYRRIKITLSVIFTMLSEAILTLGVAALLRWNLDAPSIAGIIAGMGTGVNDQIVILSETESKDQSSMKERIKNAFFIILGAFFTILAAMLPLLKAGAGMLRGFAFTTIIGVTVGILITRPAFADIIKKIDSK